MSVIPERVPVNRGSSDGIGTGALVVIIIAALGIFACIAVGLVKMCKRRPKASRDHYSSDDAMNMGQPMQPPQPMPFNTINEPPPYSTNDVGGYPQVPVPFPPGPDNPYMQGGNAPYPPGPGGPEAYPQAPGAPGYPPYPQAPGAPGYQPYPPQGPGYPPQGPGYPPQGPGYPPYPN